MVSNTKMPQPQPSAGAWAVMGPACKASHIKVGMDTCMKVHSRININIDIDMNMNKRINTLVGQKLRLLSFPQ